MSTTATENLVGAYSPYNSKIDDSAKKAFEEALKGFVGVRYTPVAVSQQVVAGLNYRFFCNTQAATQFPLNGAAIVSIYKPLNGQAHITGIQKIQQ